MKVIAIFDVGKTNKKLFLFNEQYEIVWEKAEQFADITDDDGDPCEDLNRLTNWVTASLEQVVVLPEFDVQAVNFSAYGASFVYLDAAGQPIGHLYSYLKPFPETIRQQFYNTYGNEATVSLETASPALDSLNAGLMLYRIKYDKPQLFRRIRYALHLPQYLSFLFTRQAVSDLTSIGCHTLLWDFARDRYHDWVRAEAFDDVLGPVLPSDSVLKAMVLDRPLPVGIGLHDSSAALIPYLASFPASPFVLISTGTWCVSMNPFVGADGSHPTLTAEELAYDCLFYFTHQGKPVKASRLFAGYEHEQQVRRLAEHFGVTVDYYAGVRHDPSLIDKLRGRATIGRATTGRATPTDPHTPGTMQGDRMSMKGSLFGERDLAAFTRYEEAYHQLMFDIMGQQVLSTQLVLTERSGGEPVTCIFVDGGFGKNPVYMQLLATAFPDGEVFAASVAQASALGAALAIHTHWNPNPLPANCIDLKKYTADRPVRDAVNSRAAV